MLHISGRSLDPRFALWWWCLNSNIWSLPGNDITALETSHYLTSSRFWWTIMCLLVGFCLLWAVILISSPLESCQFFLTFLESKKLYGEKILLSRAKGLSKNKELETSRINKSFNRGTAGKLYKFHISNIIQNIKIHNNLNETSNDFNKY